MLRRNTSKKKVLTFVIVYVNIIIIKGGGKNMKFGLKFTDYCIVELIDLETAEVVAEGPFSVKRWLTAYDGNYTLKIIE